MCGENTLHYNHSVSKLGSPPHVRGKHALIRSFGVFVRITPACAGKTVRCLL